ncbi:MAG: 30S ribosomal protein S4 [Armatimonadetes bacterium]|nr:30S ribosomal protein S4 [Armatimonadota bacterium]
MAKYTGARCRLCRREGMKLFLKGNRCYSVKCEIEKRNFPPGQHGQKRHKVSQYGIQLREKQKLRRTYGLVERQFKRYFILAEKKKGITGENFLQILECRLDNVVYRLGFASSRKQAGQLVSHRHFLVNGKKVNIASFLVKPGDVIKLKEKSCGNPYILQSLESAKRYNLSWLELDSANFTGKVKALPSRDDIPIDIKEELIVEFYSK